MFFFLSFFHNIWFYIIFFICNIKTWPFQNDELPLVRTCYSAMRHKEGDIVRVRDCVLLRSGPKKTDLPFVAKIAALWEDPETCKFNVVDIMKF